MQKTTMTILGLLTEKPMHGYQIKQIIKERWIDMWANISVATLYNNLNKLEKSGEIIVHRKEKVGKTPQRNVYKITESGQLKLKNLVEQNINSCEKTGTVFWLAVAFIQNADKDIIVNALTQRVEKYSGMVKHLEAIHEDCLKNSEKFSYNWTAIISRGLYHTEIEQKQVIYLLENAKKR